MQPKTHKKYYGNIKLDINKRIIKPKKGNAIVRYKIKRYLQNFSF